MALSLSFWVPPGREPTLGQTKGNLHSLWSRASSAGWMVALPRHRPAVRLVDRSYVNGIAGNFVPRVHLP